MKRTLSMIAFAALTMGLLGSCSKINERLDNLEKEVSGIENEQIASINSQIDGIKTSIADLGTIRSDISSLKQSASDHSVDIFNLEEADRALKDRILNLEDYVDAVLPNYAEKEWVEATFSTLEQYEATCDTIAKIDARIGALDTKLSKDIKATADSLTKWVNKQFEGYYTAAEMDASLAQMKSDIDSARAANKITDAKADSIATELTNAKAAVDTAKANIRAEYRAAIDTAIKASEGKLTKELTDAIKTVNGKIESLTTRVGNLETSVAALTGRVDKLEGMIQSVVIVPAYSDGSVEAVDGILELNLVVSPSSAAKGLTKDNVKILLNKVATKAVSVDTVKTEKISPLIVDETNGTVEIKADISENLPTEDGQALTVAVNVANDGISDFTTEFVPVYVTNRTFKAVYNTTGDANTLTFYYDTNDHSKEGTVYEGTGLFNTEETTAQKKWGYNEIRSSITSVVIDASVADYKGLTSTAYMFQGMTAASDISGAEYLNVSNVTDMSFMFNNFGGDNTTLNSVPNVSGWNTGNVTNMAGMFNSYGNFSDNLAIVPVVSNWNTANVTNMAGMFQKYGHESQNFNAVPDVSKWNTGNVTDMSNMFMSYGFKSKELNAVPKVDGWNTAKVEKMNAMFHSFADSSKVLAVVPNVSDWNTANVTTMADMFNGYGYKSTVLNTVPDVSKWNTGNVTTMTNMFPNYGYSSTALSTVPNVSSWKTSNVTKISNMFQNYGYSSTALNTVPDVSKWDTGKMKDINGMFQNYGNSSTALSTVPDVSKWKTGKMEDISNMFQNYGNESQSINCTLDLSGWDLSKITNVVSVFKFNPSTFNVTIPAKTGEKSNEGDKWYYGNGTDYIVPPTGKTFTPTLAGVFSVSATKKVRFSQGNLQATYNSSASTYTWGFAANQYSRIGNAAGNTTIDTQTDGAVVDLFGWSTDAASNNWGIHTKTSETDGFTTGNFKDWGKAVGDGNTWRTLSKDEWVYLINTNGEENIRKGKYKYGVTVCEKASCLILAPDDFEGTIAESYDAAAWASAEAAGLVCLPAAGSRSEYNVFTVGSSGLYWSSTADGSPAYYVFFMSSLIATDFKSSRYGGYSVRLVTEVK